MSSEYTLSLPASSHETSGSNAAIQLLVQLYVAPHLSGLKVVEGNELSLTTASTSPKTGDFLSIFKSLLEAAGQTNEGLGAGKPDGEERKSVEKWISHATSGKSLPVKELDADLKTKMYVVGNQLTAADAAVFANLQSYISQSSHETLLSHPNVTRHFDLLQHTPSVTSAIAKLPSNTLSTTPVTIDLDNVPKIERKYESSKKDKKEKKEDAAGAPAADSVKGKGKKGAEAAEPAAKADKSAEGAGKKEKKEKAKKEGGKEAAAGAVEGGKAAKKGGGGGGAAAEAEPITPGLIDLRVGVIREVKKHPDADSLYVEQIDVGEPELRTVVSGLVNYIPIEEMQNKVLICVCNLKPAAMRGIKSYAMVMAASSKDGKDGPGTVELVAPPEGSQPGDRVYFEGFENVKPLEQLPPKKKIFETIQPGLTTLDTREAVWIDPSDKSKVHKIVTSRGPCKAPTFVGASLS